MSKGTSIRTIHLKLGKASLVILLGADFKFSSKLYNKIGNDITKAWVLANHIPFFDKVIPTIFIDENEFHPDVVSCINLLNNKTVKEVLSNGLLNQFYYTVILDLKTLNPKVSVILMGDKETPVNLNMMNVLNNALVKFRAPFDQSFVSDAELSNVHLACDRRIRDAYLTRTDYKSFKDLGKKTVFGETLITSFIGTRKDLIDFHKRIEKRNIDPNWLSRIHCYMDQKVLDFYDDITDLSLIPVEVSVVSLMPTIRIEALLN